MRWTSSTKVTPAKGFFEPCLPSVAKKPPVGESWVFELKWDGYRLLVRKTDDVVRVYTRRGADWTDRYPRIVQAARKIKATSFLLDGKGIVYDRKDMPNFDLLHSRDYDKEAVFVAFDLLELNGTEVRKQPLVERKELLADFLAKVKDGIEFNDHVEQDGNIVFKHGLQARA
jgi:bifunctional non-homologous end joining protein LigD